MKRLLVLTIWFPATILALVIALFFFSFYSQSLLPGKQILKSIKNNQAKFYRMYVSHPEALGAATTSIKAEDAIPELVYQYLKKYNSPMTESAYSFSSIFRKYNINPVVPLAIAQCESNLGKKMPDNCHNPFGWGIHSKGTLCFETWEEGYDKVAQGLRKKYINQGLISPDEIMTKYNKASWLERNSSWSKCVNQFTEEIETLTIRKY